VLQPTALADPLPAAPARRARARAQIFPPDEKIDAINDTYWTVRAEPDDDAEEAGAGPSSLIHVYHYHADAQNHVRARQRPGHPGGTSMRALAPMKHFMPAWTITCALGGGTPLANAGSLPRMRCHPVNR